MLTSPFYFMNLNPDLALKEHMFTISYVNEISQRAVLSYVQMLSRCN